MLAFPLCVYFLFPIFFIVQSYKLFSESFTLTNVFLAFVHVYGRIVEDLISRTLWEFRGSGKQFAFRGRVMSLLELTLCGVSSTTHFPQESHRFPPPHYQMRFSKSLL